MIVSRPVDVCVKPLIEIPLTKLIRESNVF